MDAEAVKERFHEMSRRRAVSAETPSEGAEAINAAQTVLRDPVACLKHFLELNDPTALNGAPPTAVDPDLFMKVAAVLQRTSALRSQFAAATTPLAKALLAGDAQVLEADLDAADETVSRLFSACLAEIQRPNAASADLAGVLHRMIFLDRWRKQLSEARVQLKMAL